LFGRLGKFTSITTILAMESRMAMRLLALGLIVVMAARCFAAGP
jgi:hypothetical protein